MKTIEYRVNIKAVTTAALLLIPTYMPLMASAADTASEKAPSPIDMAAPNISGKSVNSDKASSKEDKEKQVPTVDMSDPTAVYSSVGLKADTSGKLDASAGFAWGNNQLLIESKGGGDSLSMTYANMDKGSGFYAEASGNADLRSTSIGYVTTLQLADNLKIYPVIMAGYINDELMDDVTGIVTAGFYTRYNLGSGFHLGLDPFFTYGQDGYQANAVDAFVGFQHKTHRIRLGVNEEKELTLQYNIAFM